MITPTKGIKAGMKETELNSLEYSQKEKREKGIEEEKRKRALKEKSLNKFEQLSLFIC